jgi:uncharacterized Fe-S cluster-containing radical SAM superfamily protein
VNVIHRQPLLPFSDPAVTADGRPRAVVAMAGLTTLWFNTGTRCNLTCAHCYIESSPRNDRLVYLTPADVVPYLDEIAALALPTTEIGFTGGEPFLNPALVELATLALDRGHRALVLTNGTRPMMKRGAELLALRARFGDRLALRVSVDHYRAELHEEERGRGTFASAVTGLEWLGANGFRVHVAGRLRWGDDEREMRAGFGRLFAERGIPIDADDPTTLVLFPEMDSTADLPEITTDCWAILGKRPEDVMCASQRMVVRRKGAPRPTVVACTLLANEPAFELGSTLAASLAPIALNHRHCAAFCVLGGGRCSG